MSGWVKVQLSGQGDVSAYVNLSMAIRIERHPGNDFTIIFWDVERGQQTSLVESRSSSFRTPARSILLHRLQHDLLAERARPPIVIGAFSRSQ